MREGVDVMIELMRRRKESAVSVSLRLLLGRTSQSRDNKVDPLVHSGCRSYGIQPGFEEQ